MGQFSVEKPVLPGSGLSGNQQGEVSRQVRLSAAGYLELALGGAAIALAKREAAREGETQAVRANYHEAVRAIEQAAL
jgi:hypothetical protein